MRRPKAATRSLGPVGEREEARSAATRRRAKRPRRRRRREARGPSGESLGRGSAERRRGSGERRGGRRERRGGRRERRCGRRRTRRRKARLQRLRGSRKDEGKPTGAGAAARAERGRRGAGQGVAVRSQDCAREQGMDLHGVEGTGPNGRVVARDLEGRAKDAPKAQAPAAPQGQPAASEACRSR